MSGAGPAPAAPVSASDLDFYLQVHAIVGSSRADALDPLDSNAAQDAIQARFWAEPALITMGIGALEEMGFDVLSCDRLGIHILARASVLATAFDVNLRLDDTTKPDRPVWVAETLAGAPLDTIPPKDKSQAVWLRGLSLPQPASDSSEMKSLADYQKDNLDENYPYEMLPHQMWRELCSDPSAPTVNFGTGKGVRIIVLDTGFDGSHPYWGDVLHPDPTGKEKNLKSAADAIQRNLEPVTTFMKTSGEIAGKFMSYIGILSRAQRQCELDLVDYKKTTDVKAKKALESTAKKNLKSLYEIYRKPDLPRSLNTEIDNAIKVFLNRTCLRKTQR